MNLKNFRSFYVPDWSRYPFKTCILQRSEEEPLPQRVPVLKVVNGQAVLRADVVRHVLDGQRHRPYAVVGVAVEAGILATAPGIVLRFVFVRCLEQKRK